MRQIDYIYDTYRLQLPWKKKKKSNFCSKHRLIGLFTNLTRMPLDAMNVTSVVRGRWQFHQHLSQVSSDCHHHFKESSVFISQSLMTNWTRGHIANGLRQPACRWTLGPRPAFKPCLRSDSTGTLVELHGCFLHIYDIMLTCCLTDIFRSKVLFVLIPATVGVSRNKLSWLTGWT